MSPHSLAVAWVPPPAPSMGSPARAPSAATPSVVRPRDNDLEMLSQLRSDRTDRDRTERQILAEKKASIEAREAVLWKTALEVDQAVGGRAGSAPSSFSPEGPEGRMVAGGDVVAGEVLGAGQREEEALLLLLQQEEEAERAAQAQEEPVGAFGGAGRKTKEKEKHSKEVQKMRNRLEGGAENVLHETDILSEVSC